MGAGLVVGSRKFLVGISVLAISGVLAWALVVSGSERRIVGTVRSYGVGPLRADLLDLARAPDGITKSDSWPESVRALRPLSVQPHRGGVLLVVRESARMQHGLLIMLDAEGDPGAGGSGVGYEALGEGMFWCWQKKRAVFAEDGYMRLRNVGGESSTVYR